MKVAVIGTGSMGGMHAALLSEIDGVDEVLVVDTDWARAAEVAARTGARATTLPRGIEAAEALVVATPPQLHAEAVLPALEAGRSVLCEKPLSEDLAESPAGEAAPLFLHSSIHDFDFVRWLTGQEVVEVTADASRRDGARPDDPRGAESATVLMRLSGGTLASLDATWLHPAGYDIRVELVTDREHLTMGLSARTPARHLDWVATDDMARPAAWSGYLERFQTAYRAELVAFLAAARGEQPPATSGRDGVEALRIAIAATRSLMERRAVALDEIRAGEAVEV